MHRNNKEPRSPGQKVLFYFIFTFRTTICSFVQQLSASVDDVWSVVNFCLVCFGGVND